MAITSNAAITMAALRAEYQGGSGAVSMSQLNRGGGYVPTGGARNSAIPTTDSNLAFSKYRNTSKTVVVSYEIIGGGGTGGHGAGDGGEGYRGTYGPAGGASYIKNGSSTLVTANGGAGGENCKGNRGTTGTAGTGSHYGSGGSGGARNSYGSSPSSNAYGAGGGGGGGDNGSTYDEGGCSGEGGRAGTRETGSFTVGYDTSITMQIGDRGGTNTTSYDGAQGTSGYARITWDSKSSPKTSTGTATIN